MSSLPDRSHIRRWGLVLLLAAGLWGPPLLAETGLRMSFDTTRREVPTQPAKGEPAEQVSQGSLVVRMTPTLLAVRDGDTERLYDFAARRVVTLDHAKQAAYGWSLYAVSGFRDLEFENRKVMARMMKALGQPADMVDVEAELGMLQDPPAGLKFKEVRDGNTRVFLLNQREATRFTPSGTLLPGPLAPMLSRLYLYEAQLHPRVREAITREPRLPQELEFRWRRADREISERWSLRETVEADMDLAADMHRYPDQPITDQGLLAMAWRVAGGQAGTPPTATDYQARSDKLLAEGRAFEAFLVLSELSFATGDVPDKATRRAADAAAADPRMQAWRRAMQLESSGGDPKQALALLEPLDAAKLEGGAAVQVQRANQYVRLGDGKGALASFNAALTANPFLVGPWVDAGQIYFRGYQVVAAWTCWDAARRIAPASPLLKTVNDLEAMLRRRHPEYF